MALHQLQWQPTNMIVFAADLHLRPTTWTKFPSLKGDAFYSFRQLVDYCCNEKAQALILGGDVFDSATPDSESVIVFKTGVEVLQAHEIAVFGIQGQHERSDPPWMALTPYVKCLDIPAGDNEQHIWPIACDKHTASVRGIDNMSATALKQILEHDAQNPDAHYDILVMHQAMQGLVYDTAWNLAEEWIPEFVHVVLLGDLHIEASKGKCYYSGSMNLQSIGESPQKSFITVHCSEKDGKLSVQRHMLETRDMMKFMITDIESRDAAIDTLKAYKANKKNSEIERPLIVAYVATDVPSAYDYIEAVCASNNMFLDVRTLGIPANDNSDEAVKIEAVPMEDLIEEVVAPMQFDNPEDKLELTSFSVRLLKSKDASAELMSIKQEMGIITETG